MNSRRTRSSLAEKKSLNSPLCSACMSSDRTLHPLGVNTSIFIKLFDNNYLRQSVISLCWECTAVLNKVRIFKNKVDHAQKVLSSHGLNRKSKPPTPLSSLRHATPNVVSIKGTITKAEPTNPTTNYAKDKDTDKLIFEVKTEPESDTNLSDVVLENDGYEEQMVFDRQEESDSYKMENLQGLTYEYQNLSFGVEKRIQDDRFATENNRGSNIIEIEIKQEPIDQENDCESVSYNPDAVDVRKLERQLKNDPDSVPPTRHNSTLTSGRQKRKIELSTLTKRSWMRPSHNTKPVTIKKERDGETVNVQPRKKKPRYDCTTLHILDPENKLGKRTSNLLPEYTQTIRIPLSQTEISEWLERERSSAYFANLKSKCVKCACYVTGVRVESHLKWFHAQSENEHFICDHCECTFGNKISLRLHLLRHTLLIQCLLCEFMCYSRDYMRHHLRDHSRQFQCNKCGAIFSSKLEFVDHYKILHTFLTCDYCGENFKTKTMITDHITRKHAPVVCKLCKKSYKTLSSFETHYNRAHVVAKTEATYCATCDRQFANPATYDNHFRYSVAHYGNARVLKERARCAECPKTYGSRRTMLDHYNYVHKKQSRHVCQDCGQQFVNQSHLIAHARKVHLGLKAEKNKMCTHCGRGFSASRALAAHIRTHTASAPERPHQCEQCDARFTQCSALKTHLKTQSMKGSTNS